MVKGTPGIHTKEADTMEQPKPKAPISDRNAQYLLNMRAEQRRQLTKLAVLDDKTIRGFILAALADKGLDVTEEDMVDLRRTTE